MADLSALVEAARLSELFTAPRLEADLDAFLAEQGDRLRQLARRTVAGEFDRIYFVGSGGSWSNMFTGKYLTDRYTQVSSDVLSSYELIWRDPPQLHGRALVFLASYSGATEDTLAALRHANEAGAYTVAITRGRPSPMAAEAAEVIDYDSSALYILPLAAVTFSRWRSPARRKVPTGTRPSVPSPSCQSCRPCSAKCIETLKPRVSSELARS